MAVVVSINGELFDEHASISVFDRGFLYGDSVYEVMRTSAGVPVDLAAHLTRLRRSATALALEIPSDDELAAATHAALKVAGNPESYIRIIVTRGSGEIGLSTELARDRKTIVIVRPLKLPPKEKYERGIGLQIVTVQRTSPRAVDPGVKSGNYLNNILALAEARRAGADEALMCDSQGRIAEGASSNVFVVRDGALVTPGVEIGLLPGITRMRVIELARGAGLEVTEGELVPEQVRSADEVFITSSIRGVLPVAQVDGAAIAGGAPGPITTRIMDLYGGYLRAQAGR